MPNSIIVSSVTLTVPNEGTCPTPDDPVVCVDDPADECNKCAIGPSGPPGPPGGPPPPGPPGGGCGKTTCKITPFPIRVATGELQLSAVDVASVGYGAPWGHKRSFSNRISVNLNVGNGYNWQIQQWSYLSIQADTIVVMGSPQSVLWFDRNGGTFVPRFNLRATLIYDAGFNRYKLYDLQGNITEYCGTSGRLCRYLDPYGNSTVVVSTLANGFNLTEVQRTVTSGGTTTVESYMYDYIDPQASSPLLASVTLQRKVNESEWQNVLQCSYTYYGSADSAGTTGDLRTATMLTWDGSDWAETGTSLYRYYTSAVSSSSSSSSLSSSSSSSSFSPFAHLLRFVLEPAAYNRMVADGHTPTSASDALLSLYADYYFEYDNSRRVVREIVQSGSRTFDLEYDSSGFADGYNSWKTKTVETRPDGSTMTVYSNYAGQTMLAVLGSADYQWCEYYRYDTNGFLILKASPSAISGYDEQYADLLHLVDGNYEFLKDHEGFISTRVPDPATGWLLSEKIQKGEFGTCIRVRDYEYTLLYPSHGDSSSSSSSSSSSTSSGSPTSAPAYFMTKMIVYPEDGCGCDSSSSSSSCSTGCCCSNDNTRQIVTSYDYLFYPGTTQIRQKTTTLPEIPIEQNGSGVAATRKDYFDTHGNVSWSMDERGYITRMKYDLPTGALIQLIQDVDTSIETDAPSGWVTPADGGLNLITDFEHDDQGRMTQSLGPWHNIDINGTATEIRRANWIVYQDATFQTWSAQGYATGTSLSYSYTLVNPVAIAIRDAAGKTLEQISAVRSSTSGKLLPTDSFPQSSYVRWTTTQYTDCCFAASQRVYHTIPSSGAGSSGTNYDETDYGYDVMKRQNRTVTPGGTITYRVFDTRGNAIAVYIGTNDNGATDDDPTGGVALGNNMVLVTQLEYDNGQDGADGNMTELIQHVDAATARVTEYLYDWRDRQIAVDGEIDFYQQTFHDNLNRSIRIDRRDTTAQGDLIARSETRFDDRGRVYRTIQYGVYVPGGAVGSGLTSNMWYDAANNVIQSLPAGSKLFTKTTYDGLNRTVAAYSGYTPTGTTNLSASVANDVILEQSETTYDAASNGIESVARQRYHNAPATQIGPLQDPASDPKARVAYAAMWPDSLGRTQASANYGTNGGTALSRPSTIPSRSDLILVTSMAYDSAGDLLETTDPSGIITRLDYDAVGRRISQILNFLMVSSSSSSSSPSSSSGGGECEASADTNITVLTSYNADGNVATLTAVNASTGNQVTQYVYGTTLSNSGIATSTLKRKEIYPDSIDDDDVVVFGYNRQSQVVQMTDQAGTIHEFDYDLLGRQVEDRVTALGTNVDGTVLRIETTYDVRGMDEHITSYDDALVGMGVVVNDCQFAYNDFGQLVAEYQSHDGSVNTDTTPKVQYGYEDGSNNTIRPLQLIYPNGRVLTYVYGDEDSIDDAIGRVASLIDDDGTTYLVDYSYLGHQTFVVTDYTEPETKYTLIGTSGGIDPDTGDIYRGLDRFGRVKDSYWYNYGNDTATDRIKYGHDRIGSRLWRENVVATAAGKEFDELYQYDHIHRLKNMHRGLLNVSKTALTSTAFAQCWTLDHTGNWNGFREDDTGDGAWDLDQTRLSTLANELESISESSGPHWVTALYNRNGNETTMPQPKAATSAYEATYNPWNRFVRVWNDNSLQLAEYKYDGVGRRIRESASFGINTETRHFYYTDPGRWQVIEERIDESTIADRQFIWGLRYVDDLVLRDVSILRLYALQDTNWNVTTIIDNDGVAHERFAYQAYGLSQCLSATFVPTGSESDWEIQYAGYRCDNATGLLHVRQRVLHPSLGSWLQRDTWPMDLQANLYQYVHGSPYSLTDPSGLFAAAIPWPMIIGLLEAIAQGGAGAQAAMAALRAALAAIPGINLVLLGLLFLIIACVRIGLSRCGASFALCLASGGTQIPGCVGRACPAGFCSPEALLLCSNRYSLKVADQCNRLYVLCTLSCGIATFGYVPLNCEPNLCSGLCAADGSSHRPRNI